MLTIGRHHELEVVRITSQGLMLGDGEEEVLLPQGQAPRNPEIGQHLRVFVYADSDDEPIATTTEPYGVLDDILVLECVDINDHGVFLDWGLPKDLFCPWARQHERIKVGERHVVRIQADERVRRLVATARIADDFSDSPPRLQPGDAVVATVYAYHPLGARVAVNGRHAGMLYADDTPTKPELGERLDAYVRFVRDDGRIDVSLKRPGRAGALDDNATLIAALNEHDGFLPLHDKSPPEEIAALLGMSKKAFKRAAGALYRFRAVTLDADGIRLVPKG